jgi:hypothetical protein
MSDWEQFIHEVSWFLEPGQAAAVGNAQPWTRGPVDGLPELSALLREATLTPVTIGSGSYELLGWGPSDGRRGWLCRPPINAGEGAVPPAHRDFWRVCGGIVEGFGEPTTWWTDQGEVVTVEATKVRIADLLADYAWMWEGDGFEVTIDPEDYYTVAVEANGNLTLAHRASGRLLLSHRTTRSSASHHWLVLRRTRCSPSTTYLTSSAGSRCAPLRGNSRRTRPDHR